MDYDAVGIIHALQHCVEPSVRPVAARKGSARMGVVDSFAALVNGDNARTAVFLDSAQNTVFLAVDSGDDLEATVAAADMILQRILSALDVASVAEYNAKLKKDKDAVLGPILVRNLRQLKELVPATAKMEKWMRELARHGVPDAEALKALATLDEANAAQVIRRVSRLYDAIRPIKEDSGWLNLTKWRLEKLLRVKWTYDRLMRRLLRTKLAAPDRFPRSIAVRGVPAWAPAACVKDRWTHTEEIHDAVAAMLGTPERRQKYAAFAAHLYGRARPDVRAVEDLVEADIDGEHIEGEAARGGGGGGHVHAEVALVCWLLARGVRQAEVGTARAPCLMSYAFAKALAHMGVGRFKLAATDRNVCTSWGFPEPPTKGNAAEAGHDGAFAAAFAQIARHLCVVLCELYVQDRIARESNDYDYAESDDYASGNYTSFTDEMGHISA